MRTNKKTLPIIAMTVLLCLTLSGCGLVVGGIINGLDAVFSYMGGFGEDKLPDNVVYGSANPLAVGFRNGKLVAFWDAEDGYSYTLDVTDKDDITTPYSKVKPDFDLTSAGVGYADRFSLSLRKTNLKTNTYSTISLDYSGIAKADYDKYTKNVPGGFKTIDYYIASRYELFEFFNYLIIFRPGAKSVTDGSDTYYQVDADIKLAYDFVGLYPSGTSQETAFESEIMCASASFEDSAAYTFAYELKNGIGSLTLKFYYDTYPSLIGNSHKTYRNAHTPNEPPHYGAVASERTFPVDKIKDTVTVRSSDQLYFALKKGYRPSPVAGSNADVVYNELRRILSRINSDTDNAPGKIHNIYDYLVDTVIYDYNFTEDILPNAKSNDPSLFLYKCLYLEGVLGITNDLTVNSSERVAICDGLSKAFLCMAKIEGIESIKISGKSDGGAHAWNKVQVGSKWYLVDTTWGNVLDDNAEYLSHNYLMKADDKKHIEDPWFYYPAATSNYNLFTLQNEISLPRM